MKICPQFQMFLLSYLIFKDKTNTHRTLHFKYVSGSKKKVFHFKLINDYAPMGTAFLLLEKQIMCIFIDILFLLKVASKNYTKICQKCPSSKKK